MTLARCLRRSVLSSVYQAISLFCLFSLLFPLAIFPAPTNYSINTTKVVVGDLRPISFAFGDNLIHQPQASNAPSRKLLTIWNRAEVPGIVAPKESRMFEAVGIAAANIFDSIAKKLFASEMAEPPNPTPAGTGVFDFDGDGKADAGRWHSATKEYTIRQSSNGSTSSVTFASDGRPAPADFDGDGKADPAIFSAGTWTYKKSSTSSTETISGFGQSGDLPVPGEWTGDGVSDAAVYRPSNGTWYVRNGVSPFSVTSVQFGTAGDIPLAGNFDGDSKMDQAVFRPSTGYWYINGSTSGFSTFPWGLNGDVPFAMDFDNDGKSDPGVYRPSSGTWYVLKSSTGYSTYFAQAWGNYGDQPVPADINGDGKADFSVWRPTTGVWHTLLNGPGTYDHQTLGVPGDFAVTSAYIKQVGSPATGSAIAASRLDPKNATGGTDLYSRNFSWGSGLVSLSGRSGLNAGLGLSYNSLVWLKNDSTMVFDPDVSNVSPGFRIGLPTIEPAYYNDDKQAWAYLMISGSGERVEFLQTGAANNYESMDSTYAVLTTKGATNPNDPVEGIDLTVTSTNGSVLHYTWIAGAYRCDEIKDRNGNYVTVTNSTEGLLTKITDTLGREINVVYDNEFYPTSITQSWKSENGSGSASTHTYATFSYTTKTVDTNWDATLNVYGPPDGAVLKVLDKITYADGSSTAFDYNGYLQVQKIRNIAADSSSHVLNYVSTDLDSVSGTQTDCPRFGATRSWVENFNGENETVVTNSLTTGTTYSLPGGLTGSATRIDVAMTGHPDGLYTRTYVGESGWQEGLPLATEDCTGTGCSDRKRWTYTAWTQDNTTLGYKLNPRVVESRVGDGSNVKRTTIDYYESPAGVFPFGLPAKVQVYDSDLATVLKTQTTSYNLSSTYVNRRIIGLPAETDLFEGSESGTLMSKVTYSYDEGTMTGTDPVQNISPVQHDNANFGSSFVVGRGLLTSVMQWDAQYPTSTNYAVTSTTKYNTAGSPVSRTTPWDGTSTRTVRIGYADSWNDGVSRSTYAYPTVLTDPAGTTLGAAGHSSTVKYRFDIGANVEAVSPAPAGQTYGKTSRRKFDDYGRIEKESVLIDTAEQSYVRYVYPTNGVQAQSYATVVDANGNGPDSADEVASESLLDGAGRTLAARTEHPGSTGGWSAVTSSYDVLGRLYSQSVPTEVDPSWAPAGDDATRGWLYSYNFYDWKGRPTRTVPSDSNGTDGKDTLISYEGCGCAGGQVTTVRGPVTTAKDVSGTTQTTKRRAQKSYEDILGRTFKVETWDLDAGGASPYKTILNTFNGRDQVTLSREYAGGTSSSTYQDTTFAYNGLGRVVSSHKPEERDADNTLKYTQYVYNPDGSVASLIDPRGAITSFTYNSRGLKTNIDYAPPATQPTYTTIDDTPSVAFTYDNLGNRTGMTDGSGTHAYAYDPLSRLVSETQTFTGLTGNFTTSYSYELSGKLKAVTDAFSDAVYYNNDVAGRTTSITGSSFAGVSSYATGIKYRAFGALKEMTYSSTDSAKVSYDFDAALRPVSYEATSSVLSGGYVRKASYEYFNDGSMKKVNDLLNASFDQTYSYDFAGRLASSTTGTALNRNDETVTPYAQTIQYDAFGNMTHRTTDVWGNEDGFTATYANNRKASGGVLDNEGNMVDSTVAANNYSRWEFDASGKNVETKMAWRIGHVGETQIDRVDTIVPTRDGDGVTVKRVDTKTGTQVYPVSTTTTIKTEYYLISTVLGGKVLTELTAAGTKKRTSVYVGSGVLAEQLVRAADDTHSTEWEEILFKHEDIVTGSYNKTNGDGTLSTSGEPPARAELEPLGGRIPDNDPEVTDEAQNFDLSTFRHFGNVESAEFGCELDGMPFPCSLVDELRRGDESHYKFGIRYQGDEHGAWGLSTFVRDIYKDDEGPDKTPVPDKGPIKVEGATRYQYSIYSLLFSPSASSHGPSPDSGEWDPLPFTDCPPVPAWPSNANLDANIELAKRQGGSWWNPLKPAYDAKAAVWFYDQVKNKGPWDYKQQGKQYQDFGNFNYGATGLALGFDETTLLREAGRAQQAAGTSKKEWGEPGYRLNPFGGTGSYGDDPDDQEQIKKGFAYYYAKQKGCTWKN